MFAKSDHVQLVRDSIGGSREVDEHTGASIAILQERLERIQKTNAVFADISFSPAVEQMKIRQEKILVS